MLSLCVEIYIILKLKAYSSSHLRLIIYNTIVLLFSGLIVLILFETDSLGISELRSCLVKSDSPGEKLDLALNGIFFLFLITSYIAIKKQLGCCYSPAFHNLSKVILILCITVFISRVIVLIVYIQHADHSDVSEATIIIGIFCAVLWGSSVSLSRLFHPKVIRRVKELCGYKERPVMESLIQDRDQEELLKSILNMTIDDASDDIADMFDNLGHKTIIQILVLLTLRYRDYQDICACSESSLKNSRKKQEPIHYSDFDYHQLSEALMMPFIDKVYCPDVSIIEFESSIFRCIMKACNIEKSEILDSLLSFDNLKSLASVNNKGGRSNAFFYASTNEKIVIKTITSQERITFLKFLPTYVKRLTDCPSSKLVRILGLFQILPHRQDFIVMENAIPAKRSAIIFDLKGSSVNRHVSGIDSENPPNGVVLKDLNFKRYGKKIDIDNREEVLCTMFQDMKILRNCKLMDYSMLVAIYEKNGNKTRYSVGERYSIAIIDFFQHYGAKKSLERVWKRYILRRSQGISVISPNLYYRRIKNYVKGIVIDKINQS